LKGRRHSYDGHHWKFVEPSDKKSNDTWQAQANALAEEARQNLRQRSLAGRQKTAEYHRGKTLSEEHRRKLSEARRGKTLSEETRRKLVEANQKPVMCIETNEVFDSILIAALSRNKATQGLCAHLKGKQKSFDGHHWKYVETSNSGAVDEKSY
jgi:hypothetical protein